MNKHFAIVSIALPSLLASFLGAHQNILSGFQLYTDGNGQVYITTSGTGTSGQVGQVYVTSSGNGSGSSSGQIAPNSPAPISSASVPSNSSLNWTGYAATGGSFTSVGATWNV